MNNWDSDTVVEWLMAAWLSMVVALTLLGVIGAMVYLYRFIVGG